MTFGAILYFAILALWSAVVAYLIIFTALPRLTGKGKPVARHASRAKAHPAPVHHAPRAAAHKRFSPHEGFRSFAEGVELTVEDIVKGLSKEL